MRAAHFDVGGRTIRLAGAPSPARLRVLDGSPPGAFLLLDVPRETGRDAARAILSRTEASAPRTVALAATADLAGARGPLAPARWRGETAVRRVRDAAAGARFLLGRAAPGDRALLFTADRDGRVRRLLRFRRDLPRLLGRPPARVLDPRLRGLVRLAARDPRFAALVEAAGPPEFGAAPSTFETLARAVAYQQISGHAAAAIWARVLDLFPGRVLDAGALLRRRPATLRRAGLSAAKTAAIRDLARHVVTGRLDPPGLATLSDEDVVAKITQVHGLGVWSAHMHLIFSLGRLDVWPTGELGVRKGAARYFGRRDVPSPAETGRLGEPFRPFRTLLAWYLWRIHDVDTPA